LDKGILIRSHAESQGRRTFIRGGHLSEEVRVTSGVPQGSILDPLLFLAYVNDISRNIESTIRLFADDCVIYRKITNKRDIEMLQTGWGSGQLKMR
jgi:hypothetical protein